MRRERLIWFAVGAGVSAAVSVFTSLFWPKPTPKVPLLVLEEPAEDPTLGESAHDTEYRGIIASETGELLRDCGAKSFEMSSPIGHARATADLPITTENAPAFSCVLTEVAARGHLISIELRTDRNAKTH